MTDFGAFDTTNVATLNVDGAIAATTHMSINC